MKLVLLCKICIKKTRVCFELKNLIEFTNMLAKRLCSVLKRNFPKYLSTVPSPEIENEVSEEIGSIKENEILQDPDYFKVYNLFTVKDLFNAKVHYGHKTSTLHNNMKPFVFGSRLGHVIFDLDVTAYHLREALNFTAHMAYRDGIILFVSKNPRMTLLVERTAKKCKEYALTRECMVGLFTDSDKKFQTFIRLPDLVIFLNTLEENGFQHQLVTESAKMCIPTIGIVDSNCNPNLITYPVPGNDDSFSCFKLYCHLFERAILRGKNEREKNFKSNSEVDNSTTDVNKSFAENTTVASKSLGENTTVASKSLAENTTVASKSLTENTTNEAASEKKNLIAKNDVGTQ